MQVLVPIIYHKEERDWSTRASISKLSMVVLLYNRLGGSCVWATHPPISQLTDGHIEASTKEVCNADLFSMLVYP